MKRLIGIILLFSLLGGYAQELSNLRFLTATPQSDSLKLDTLAIIPGSVKVFDMAMSSSMPESSFYLDQKKASLFFSSEVKGRKLLISYRTYSFRFADPLQPDIVALREAVDSSNVDNGETEYRYAKADLKDPWAETRLNKRGSMSRGIRIGSQQNASLSSNMNLQLNGNLTKNLKLKAAITDQNIPLQPDGTTQQLNEFDKVFIQIYNDDFDLTAGDFNVKNTTDYFLRYNKKLQGGQVAYHFSLGDDTEVHTRNAAAISKGKSQRMNIEGEEGNQGPYKLKGANNEAYIIIVAGSERVYIDGERMQRGRTNDYIIDYNTGELTFTAKQPITKDKRIIVEFEYTDRNYTRFQFQSETRVVRENSEYFVNYYTNADNKNMPVDQELNDPQKQLLAAVGDDLDAALYPSWDSTGYQQGQVRYRITDTTVSGISYDSVFVYGTNEDEAVYTVGFSMVGANKGNYVRSDITANGRVYEWVAPENGVPQGEYAPVNQIISPKKQQMLTMGGKHRIANHTKLQYELALSDNDMNSFSSKDAGDDQSFAAFTSVEQEVFSESNKPLTVRARYHFIRRNFSMIENFRETEFRRNWQTDSILSGRDEQNAGVDAEWKLPDNQHINYKGDYLSRGGHYEGYRNRLNGSISPEKWQIRWNGDFLMLGKPDKELRFLKQFVSLARNIGNLQAGIEEKQERNIVRESGNTGSESFEFREIRSWIRSKDSAEMHWNLGYKYRQDHLPGNSTMRLATRAHDLSADVDMLSGKRVNLSGVVNYRKLNVLNATVVNDSKTQNNLNSRINLNHRSDNGAFGANIGYEIGSGLELKKEYTYIEVAAGQGNYTWTDYNGNGVQELEEFDVAAFSDQANYIRLFTPTDEYIKTFNNQLSFNSRFKPRQMLGDSAGSFSRFMGRFSDRLSLNLSNKNTAEAWQEQFNPFSLSLPDTVLVFINSSLRNVFSFNKMSNVLGMDYITRWNRNNMLLLNGVDEREQMNHVFRLRWQISRHLSLTNEAEMGQQRYESEYLSSKNYDIDFYSDNIRLSFQPNLKMRISLDGEYLTKQNTGGELLNKYLAGAEFRANTDKGAMISGRVNYIRMNYSGETGTSLSYEMLEGLQPGDNMTWTVQYQQRLVSGLQISINYSGRKTGAAAIVHTGGVQMRAYF